MWWLRDKWSAFKIWRLERQLFHLFEIRLREIYHEAGAAAVRKATGKAQPETWTVTNSTSGVYLDSSNVQWTLTDTH